MSEERPSIILITTDQQRGDCISIDEQSPDCLQTPHLDMLADSGIRFRRGYTECPSCVPARRTLMTGTAPASQGMVGMRNYDFQTPQPLAGVLSDNGYHSYLVGKSHLQPRRARFGFDHQVLSDGPVYPHDDAYHRWLQRTHGYNEWDAGFAHGQNANGWDARPNNIPEEHTHTYWCVSEAIDFLQYHRDPTSPFFLHVSMFDPHPPITPPKSYWDRYANRDIPQPAVGDWADQWDDNARGQRVDGWRINLPEQLQHDMRAGYYATCQFIDDQVNRLLQAIQRGGVTNAYIVFTSDHGEMLGDHHLFRKCWPYEGSARVPYFITHTTWIGNPQRKVIDQPVGLQDVMPTCLDLAGIDMPEGRTGVSLAPIMRSESDTIARDILHGEHAGQYDYNDGVHYLISDRYKYIWYSQRDCEHLFDLHEDPMELHDLSRKEDADATLAPWREKMIQVLKDRPEGFVKDGKLSVGAPHECHVPGHDPNGYSAFV